MDLVAYAQIGNLEQYMVDNGIFVPRLRGLRWMKNEEPIDRERIEGRAKWIGLYECESACESRFVWHPFCFELSEETRRLKHRYLVYKDNEVVGIRWNKIHGKKRKLFKYNMRMAKRRVEESLATFNKYCGREDILYIHARIGGGNWTYHNKEHQIDQQPWFLERIDDPFDSTYCDIYAKVEVKPNVEQ